ncbi:hypothetical protein [Streptomyces sp. NPDC055140]
MHPYTTKPGPNHEAPATLWASAKKLIQYGREVASGQREPTLDSGGHRRTPVSYVNVANEFRRSALIGALWMRKVPVMPAGYLLAPHPLGIWVDRDDLSVTDALGDRIAPRQLPALHSDAVAVLITALDEATRSCTRTPRVTGAYPSQGDTPCTACAAWWSRHRP